MAADIDDDDPEAALRDRFAISPLMDLEINVGGEGRVGLAADASHQLRLNVTASAIAEKMGYASVDYVRKRYLLDTAKHEVRDAELRILRATHIYSYDRFYHSFQPPRTNAPLGIFAFDLAMVRARSALELLSITARQGFLLEAFLIARALLEQFAYAAYVWDKFDDRDVFEVRPQSLIKQLLPTCASAGRAYGFLSQLSHYDPKIHYHFIGDNKAETVQHRSWRFKIIATAWTFYIFHLKFLVFKNAYQGYEKFSLLKDLPGSALLAFDRHFNGVDNYWVEQVRELMVEPTRE